MAADMTQAEFNQMLQIALAQGLPGGNYTLRYSGEEIDAALAGVLKAGTTAITSRTVNLAASELQNYLNSLPRLVVENMAIYVEGSLTGNVELYGFYGPGSIFIIGKEQFTLYGQLEISHSYLQIRINHVTFDASTRNVAVLSQANVEFSRVVQFHNCTFLGEEGSGSVIAVNSSGASMIAVNNSEIKNVDVAVSAQNGSIIIVLGNTVWSGNKLGANVYAGLILLAPSTQETLGAAANSNNSGLIIGKGGKLL